MKSRPILTTDFITFQTFVSVNCIAGHTVFQIPITIGAKYLNASVIIFIAVLTIQDMIGASISIVPLIVSHNKFHIPVTICAKVSNKPCTTLIVNLILETIITYN